MVARLEEFGFLERRPGERGRGVALHITEAGEKALAEADERKAALNASSPTPSARSATRELVRLLTEALPIVTALERGD